MSKYNPATDMPGTLDEWNELVEYRLQESQAAYEKSVAKAKAQAQAAYAELPDGDGKPSLEDYIAQAVGIVEQPQTREQLEQMYAIYYPQEHLELLSAPTTEELFMQLRSIREVKLREYDNKISQLDRLIRMHPTQTYYQDIRSKWDVYAVELCDITEQDSAPWDGGLSQTPWPERPE